MEEKINTIKCIPHIKETLWKADSISTDLDKNTMTINLIGKPIIDYIEMTIVIGQN